MALLKTGLQNLGEEDQMLKMSTALEDQIP